MSEQLYQWLALCLNTAISTLTGCHNTVPYSVNYLTHDEDPIATCVAATGATSSNLEDNPHNHDKTAPERTALPPPDFSV
jgi:hypothetical protein